MPLSRLRDSARAARTHTLHTESLLVEQYADLVRLAYLVLPPSFGRHRRVLLAHSLVQRSLPEGRPGRAPHVPPPRGGAAPEGVPARHRLRAAVLGAALRHTRRPRGWPERARPPRALVPRLPVVLGLRLFPRSGSAEDMVLGRLLAGVDAGTRAAFVLRRLDGLAEGETELVLRAAGVADPARALRAAARLGPAAGPVPDAAEPGAGPQEFDACTVQAHPTDLLRRRRRSRLALGVVAATAVTATALLALNDGHRDRGPDRSATVAVPRADDLHRSPPDSWADTSRVDFTAWPARGARIDDDGLLARALSTWAEPPGETTVTRAPGTADDPPPRSPQLLYAGPVSGRTVVLLYDGLRLARYSEPATGRGPAALAVARADDADVTTAAAVALDVRKGSARYLLAPWIAEAGTRDLLRPDVAARPLGVGRDGVTGRVPVIGSGPACGSRAVLQLRSSTRIAEDHAFLLAGRGSLSPVHLTYTPLPGKGAPPARQPREATGPAALVAWSRSACALAGLDEEVRAVNLWDFAEQDLPRSGGHAVWSCSRAVTWQGPGDAAVALRATAGAERTRQSRVVALARSTALCGHFGQDVVAAARWRAPDGGRYLLAAGSREVAGLTVSGDVTARTDQHTLAVRAPADTSVRVAGRLADGGTLDALGGPAVTP
ncbi:hypothetical protein ACGFZL_25975 [Streptomyces sp. NPDC048182]|uniref:hypothetical protein n=1 Tax=Streptomyces sp. NPDC048182 TaxID=3365507 RepID=UPI0037209A2B